MRARTLLGRPVRGGARAGALAAAFAAFAAGAGAPAFAAASALTASQDIAFAFTATPPAGACDDGWVFVQDPAFPGHPGSCYRTLHFGHTEAAKKTQSQAQAACEAFSDAPGSRADPQTSALASARSLNELAALWLLCPLQCHIGLQITSGEWFYAAASGVDGRYVFRTFDPQGQTFADAPISDRVRWLDGTNVDAMYWSPVTPANEEPFLLELLAGAYAPLFGRSSVLALAFDDDDDFFPTNYTFPVEVSLLAADNLPASFPSQLRSYFSAAYEGGTWATWPPVSSWTSWADLAVELGLDATPINLLTLSVVRPGGNVPRAQAICKKQARTDHPCYANPCSADEVCVSNEDGSSHRCICPAGKFLDATTGACAACNATAIAPTNGFQECQLCPAGRVADVTRTSCVPCAAGTYRDDASSACTLCPSGLVSLQPGQAECVACPTGSRVADVNNPSACADINECTSGTPVCVPTATACQNFNLLTTGNDFRCFCPEGFAGNGRINGTGCTQCTGRTVTSTATSRAVTTRSAGSSCVACADGTVPNAAHSACLTCAAGTFGDATSLGPTCPTCALGLTSTSGSASCDLDVNECAQSRTVTGCHVNATCVNYDRRVSALRFECVCAIGFGGNGRACRAVPYASFRAAGQSFFAVDGSVAFSPDAVIDIYHQNASVRAADLRITVASADPNAPAVRTFTELASASTRAASGLVLSLTLQLQNPLNYETTSNRGPFSFTVTISDGGSTTSATVGTPLAANPFVLPFDFRLVDANDAPIFLNSEPSSGFVVYENASAGTEVGRIFAYDEDNHPLTFSITGGTAASSFHIHPTTGVLTVAAGQTLDYETNQQVTVVVTVSDGEDAYIDFDSRRLSAGVDVDVNTDADVVRAPLRQRRRLLATHQTFTVQVLNAREPPRFVTSPDDPEFLEISKAADVGEPVRNGHIRAVDDDTLSYGEELFWRVVGGSNGWQAFDFELESNPAGIRTSTLLLVHPDMLDETEGDYVIDVLVEVRDAFRWDDPNTHLVRKFVHVAVRCLPSACDEDTEVPFGACSRSAPRLCTPRLRDDEAATEHTVVLPGYPQPTTLLTGDRPGRVAFAVVEPTEGGGAGRVARQPDCTTHVDIHYNTGDDYAAIRSPHLPVRILERNSGHRVAVAAVQGHVLRLNLGILNAGQDEDLQFEAYDDLAREWLLIGSSVRVPTRCFCAHCVVAEATFKNPVCREDSYAAETLPLAQWCLPCSRCEANEWESVPCEGGSPFQDRECDGCRACSYDEYMVRDCADTANRVCSPKLLPGWPQRNDDGATGASGSLFPVIGAKRDRDCNAVVGFRLSDRAQADGAEVWFKVADDNSAFHWTFLAHNHQEYRFNFGRIQWASQIRFALYRLDAASTPSSRPDAAHPDWVRVTASTSSANSDLPVTVTLGDACVAWFPLAPVLDGWPARSTRVTGALGHLEPVYGDGRRNVACHALVSVRYVHPGGPPTAIFLVATGDQSTGWRVELRNGEEAWVDLGTLAELLGESASVPLFLLSEADNGEWTVGNSIRITQVCDVTHPPVHVVPGWPVRSALRTGLSGALEELGSGLRTIACDVRALVRYVTEDGPNERTFVLRVSTRDPAPGSVSEPILFRRVTLTRGTEAVVLVGSVDEIPRSDNLILELLFQDSRGDWRTGDSFRPKTACEVPLSPATERAGSRRPATLVTTRLGAFTPLFDGGLRDANCLASFRITYNDPEECAPNTPRSFAVIETWGTQPEDSQSWSVTLGNGQEVEVIFPLPAEATDRRVENSTRFTLERINDANGGRTLIGSFAVTDLCASDINPAPTVPGTRQRFDLETSATGRVDAIYAGQRAPRDAALGFEECDPVVRVAYSAVHGQESRVFLVGDDRPRARFTLANNEQMWVNLRGLIDTSPRELRVSLWHRTSSGTWQRSPSVATLGSSCVSLPPALQWLEGFPRVNLAPTASAGRVSIVAALTDEVIVHVQWCDVRTASASDFALTVRTPANPDARTLAFRLPPCHEGRTQVALPDDGSPSVEVGLLRYDGNGGWLDEGVRDAALRST